MNGIIKKEIKRKNAFSNKYIRKEIRNYESSSDDQNAKFHKNKI